MPIKLYLQKQVVSLHTVLLTLLLNSGVNIYFLSNPTPSFKKCVNSFNFVIYPALQCFVTEGFSKYLGFRRTRSKI